MDIEGIPTLINDCLSKWGLGGVLRRHIKIKEEELGRKCRMVWTFTNPKGERFMFGSFCKKWNRLYVTIAYWRKDVGFLPCR